MVAVIGLFYSGTGGKDGAGLAGLAPSALYILARGRLQLGSFPRGANGFARVDPRNAVAFAICQRCGQRYNRTDLVWQYDWRGSQLQNLRIKVCRRKCLDEYQPQLRAYSVPPDPIPVEFPLPDMSDQYSSFTPYLTDELGNLITDEFGHNIVVSQGPAYANDFANNGGVLQVLNTYGWPQQSGNLPPGAVYVAGGGPGVVGGLVYVIPGAPYYYAQPLMFGVLSAAQLLLNGAASIITFDPVNLNQVWNNQGLLCVSLGL